MREVDRHDDSNCEVESFVYLSFIERSACLHVSWCFKKKRKKKLRDECVFAWTNTLKLWFFMQRFIQCSFQCEYLSSIFLSFFFFKHSRKRWSNFYKIYRRYKRKHIRIIKLKSPYNFHIHLARLFFPPRETREIFFFLSFFLSTNLRSSLPLTVDSFYSENVHLYTR